jgi:competence protein ComEC
MCKEPVGEGAKRVTTLERSVIGTGDQEGRGSASSTGLSRAPSRAILRALHPAAIWALVRTEAAAQVERWPLWTPIAFGSGAAIYFGLKAEPDLGVCLVLALASLLPAIFASVWGRSRALLAAAILIAFAATGFANGALATHLAAAPRIPAAYGVGAVEGWVVDVASPSDQRGRLLIAPTRIARLKADALPARIRIVVPHDAVIGPGEAIRVTALLDPPPRPAAPGAYDFARDAWFERIGGVGVAMKPPSIISLPAPRARLRAELWLNRLRWRVARGLADDVRAIAPGAGEAAAGLTVAVTTSHEGWLPASSADDLRGSGLAHMLAIAGLHTAAVSGFVFAALRLGVALWPWLAVRVSGKKVAAAGALIAVLCYLALSGAHPPAKRAAITAGVAFIAILLDRRAISLRSLAVAALAVLALQPEAIVQPGFQMSFCATGALVAMAEIWPRRAGRIAAPLPIKVLQGLKDWTLALIAVSVVAGAATGPFAIQHFNRMANYGAPANLVADFIASAVMMPALALGREALAAPLTLAAWAARGILEIGRLCSTAPGAAVLMPSAPPIAMLVAFVGILFGILWKGHLRWIGVPLAFAVLLWPRPPAPIGWIANDGNNAAIVSDGRMVVLKPGARTYATDLWRARRGFAEPAHPDEARDALFDCSRKGCAPLAGTEPSLGAWWSTRPPPQGLVGALCQVAKIVVVRADVQRPPECADRVLLLPDDFDAYGAAEIFRTSGGYRLSWSEPPRGRRPWTGTAGASDTDE